MQGVIRGVVLAALLLGSALFPVPAGAQDYYDPNYQQYPQYYDPYGQGQYGYYGYPPPYGAYGYNPYGQYGYNPYGYGQYGYNLYPYTYPYSQYGYSYGQYGYPPYGYGTYGAYPYGPYGYGQYAYGQYGYPAYGAPYPGWGPYPAGGYPPLGSLYPPYGGAPGAPCYGGAGLTLNVTQTGNTAFLSWTAYPGATSYNLLQGINGAPPTLLKNLPGATTDTEVLLPGNSYVWQVQAIVNGAPVATSPPTQPITATATSFTGVQSGIVSPTLSRIVAGQQCASMAAGTTVTVQVRDTNNVPMINQPVWVQALSPNAIVTPNQLNTDASGNTPAFSVRAQYPGPVQIGASVNGVPIQPPVTIYFQ